MMATSLVVVLVGKLVQMSVAAMAEKMAHMSVALWVEGMAAMVGSWDEPMVAVMVSLKVDGMAESWGEPLVAMMVERKDGRRVAL